jgi:hypothetical protein
VLSYRVRSVLVPFEEGTAPADASSVTPRAVPTVCVALSVRDGGEYLPEAIESVLAQEEVSLELRIYDNGSTDGSFAVYERFRADPRVVVASNPEGAHFYTSMNRALAETEADWFVPWCADDVMLPRNIVTKLHAAEQHSAQLACAPVVSLDAGGQTGKVICDELGPATRVFDPPALFAEIAPWNRIALPGLLAASSALRAVGGFDERLYLVGDWMMWLRLSLRVRSVSIPEPGVLYREHGGNTTSAARRSGTFARELVWALKAVYRDPAFPPELRWTFREHLIEILSGQSYSHLGSGLVRVEQCPRPAYALAFDALLLDPTRAPAGALYLNMLGAGGLPPTVFPASVVSAPAPTPGSVGLAMQALRRLLGVPQLVRRAQIAVRAEDADTMIALLERDLERHGDLDLEVSVVADPLSLLQRGDIFIAEPDSQWSREAEQCGAAIVGTSTPDPLELDDASRLAA